MIRTGDGWKLAYYPHIDRWQLFDLNTDPLEKNDLSSSGDPAHLKRKNALKVKLEAWRKDTGDPLLSDR
jgi:choline-sulfatase